MRRDSIDSGLVGEGGEEVDESESEEEDEEGEMSVPLNEEDPLSSNSFSSEGIVSSPPVETENSESIEKDTRGSVMYLAVLVNTKTEEFSNVSSLQFSHRGQGQPVGGGAKRT